MSMSGQIVISYPEILAFSLKMREQEFEREMKIISLVKLYELGKISSGMAAKILNIPRIDFLSILSLYNTSCFSTCEKDLESDFDNA